MDEAFTSLAEMIRGLMPAPGEIRDDLAGVRFRIQVLEIESPVEVDLSRDAAGALRIGSVPPLYRADTTYRPSYHRLRFVAALRTDHDGR